MIHSIPIKEKWEKVEYIKNGVERKFPYCDYYIYPESKWNYAFASDDFTIRENEFEAAFDTKKPPLTMLATVKEEPWEFNCGHCDEEPISREPISEPQKIELIPYGCTNLRMTEIPYLGNIK